MLHKLGNSPSPLRQIGCDHLLNLKSTIIKKLIKKVLYLDEINKLYQKLSHCQDSSIFISNLLQHLNVSFHIDNQAFSSIPLHGPVIVVANHPFGGIEGIVLGALLKSIRVDVKLMANYLLQSIPELENIFIYVDPFDRNNSIINNIRPLKKALEWLHHGGMLGIFPAGEVSHLQWCERAIADPAWNPNCARLIRKTGSTVVPLFFHGVNGPLFQILGLVHPLVRTMLLPHELLNKRGKTIHLTVGNAIPFEKLRSFASDGEMMDYLRMRTYILKAHHDQGKSANQNRPLRSSPKTARESRCPFP